MQETKNLSDYCVRVKDVVNKMATLGQVMSKKVVIKKVLRSLILRWNNVVIIIEERKDLATLEYDQLVGSRMSCEERLTDSSIYVDEKAFSCKV